LVLMLSRGGSVKRKATRKTVCPLNRIEQRPSSVRKRIGGSRGRLLISGSDRRCLSLEELLPDGVAEGFICATWRWPVAQETYRLGGSGRFTSVTRFGCDCLLRAARPFDSSTFSLEKAPVQETVVHTGVVFRESFAALCSPGRYHSPPLRACVSRDRELPKAAHQSPRDTERVWTNTEEYRGGRPLSAHSIVIGM
jgi:hypothetical protein